MQTLDAEEIKKWLELNAPRHLSKNNEQIRCEIPSTSREQALLAVFFVKILLDCSAILVRPIGWNIWPSEENMILIQKFRESYGELKPLIQTPGHLFNKDEIDAIIAFVRLSIAFGWDVQIHSNIHSECIEFNHRSQGVLTLQPKKIDKATKFLQQADLLR